MNLDAVNTARFLYYYRIMGTMLFEIMEIRALLVVFPNTFEFFFIFYHAVSLRWNENRLSRRNLLTTAAFIWVGIKIPQEYWLHIVQRDTTDFLLEHPSLIGLIVAIAVLIVAVLWWLVTTALPPADHAFSFSTPDPLSDPCVRDTAWAIFTGKVFDRHLLEKVILVSLVSVIFSQMLPTMEPTPFQVSVSVSILVVLNTILTEWIAHQRNSWHSMVRQFSATALLNAGLSVIFIWLLPVRMSTAPLANTFFFVLLITLLVTYYDTFRPSYLLRIA